MIFTILIILIFLAIYWVLQNNSLLTRLPGDKQLLIIVWHFSWILQLALHLTVGSSFMNQFVVLFKYCFPVFLFVNTHTHMCIFVCAHTHTHTCVFVCAHTCVCVCVCVVFYFVFSVSLFLCFFVPDVWPLTELLIPVLIALDFWCLNVIFAAHIFLKHFILMLFCTYCLDLNSFKFKINFVKN